MKRITSIILAICVAACLCACAPAMANSDNGPHAIPDSSIEYIGIYSGLQDEDESTEPSRPYREKRIQPKPKVGLDAFEYELVNDKAYIFDYHDKEVRSIQVPESLDGYVVAGIEERAFEQLAAESIELPNTIEVIEDGAFASCPNLKQVKVGAKAEQIGEAVFDGCDNVCVVTPIGSTMAKYCEKNGITRGDVWQDVEALIAEVDVESQATESVD